MIFGVVGSHAAPFDRLIADLEWARTTGLITEQVIIQTGTSSASAESCECFAFCDRKRFDHLIEAAAIVVCHGGIGTILSAARAGKRVIAMPRRSSFSEHNSDHQLDICLELSNQGIIQLAHGRADLARFLTSSPQEQTRQRIHSDAVALLTNVISRHVSESLCLPQDAPPDIIAVLAGDTSRRHPVLGRAAEAFPLAALTVTGTHEVLRIRPDWQHRVIQCPPTHSTITDAQVLFEVVRSCAYRKLLVITSRSHRRRAAAVFKKTFMGTTVTLSFVEADDYDGKNIQWIANVLREAMKAVYYRLRGFA